MKLVKTYPLIIKYEGTYINRRMVYNPRTQESIWFEVNEG